MNIPRLITAALCRVQSSRISISHYSAWALIAVWACVAPTPALAQTFQLDSGMSDSLFEEFEKEMAAETADLDKLKWTHYTELYRWQGVLPARPGKDLDKSKYSWKPGAREDTPPRTLVSPTGKGQATTVVAIPEAREYRIWLGYMAEKGQARPVTLSMSGANSARHEYGKIKLGPAPGSEQEKQHPIRFEDEINRIKAPSGKVMLWEFVDLQLKPGATTLVLESDSTTAQVDGVLICASKTYSPSKSIMPGEANLYKTWCRVRVSKAAGGAKTWSLGGARLGYHWRRIPKGKTEPLWGSALGSRDSKGFVSESGSASMKVGEWTRWVDITEDIMDGPWARGGGSWATASFSFKGVPEGQSEVQIAWYPHPDAALTTVAPGVLESSAICMMPMQALSVAAVSGTNYPDGCWGMRDPKSLARMETAADVHKRHFEWGKAALEKLGAAATNPVTRLIRVMTGNGAAPADRETALNMLAMLGINDLRVKDKELSKKLGSASIVVNALDSQLFSNSHDPLDPAAEANFEASLRSRTGGLLKGRDDDPQVRVVMGDEIGPVAGGAAINGLETCRKAFHDYLRTRLEKMNQNAMDYYGVEDVDDLPYLDSLPSRAGLHERRLFYDCARFKFELTAMYYAQFTRAAEKVFPKVYTYCNFTPHPPMFGQHMNSSDWFFLNRRGGASMGWGECWATREGSWGFTGFDIVSYYAAWVECAARTRGGLPAGFYVVGGTGGSDNKFFSLIVRGINWLQAYDWGPLYAGAEGSNFWSENPGVYAQIARGTHAMGPADELLALGTRETRRAAVLYNRCHEIWNAGANAFQTDRLLQFLALSHAHIPAEIIIEEDCTDEALSQYKVLYVQGHNLEPEALAALRRWVENGGVLVGVAGTAIRDHSNTPTAAAESIFGATQRIAGASKGGSHPHAIAAHQPIDSLTIKESELTPAMTVDVIGLKVVLTPTTGREIGTYKDGSCAAVINDLGKGHALLLGVQPGLIYKGVAKGSSRYMEERRALITRPAEAAVGRRRLEYSEPLTEICLFEKDGKSAVTLNNFAHYLEPKDRTTVLTLETSQKVKEVFSTLSGPLKWSRQGERIRVEMTAPATVDVVILQ